jgi:amino acid permease
MFSFDDYLIELFVLSIVFIFQFIFLIWKTFDNLSLNLISDLQLLIIPFIYIIYILYYKNYTNKHINKISRTYKVSTSNKNKHILTLKHQNNLLFSKLSNKDKLEYYNLFKE